MNNKGQIGVGILLTTFVALIVGVVLFQAVAQQAGSATTLGALTNEQITAPANGGTYVFTEYKLLDGVTITNETGTTISTGNYTISNNQVTNGALSVVLTVDSAEYQSVTWNVTATTAQATTYISDSGARSVTGLIAIFFALAVMVVALVPSFRNGILDMMK